MSMNHAALDVVFRQRDAWNRGDREGYLADCAPDIVYVSSGGVALGRDALRKTFATAYPDPRSMGTLTLEILRVNVALDQVSVVLRWQVNRAEAPVGGVALVIVQEHGGVWVVTHDATVANRP